MQQLTQNLKDGAMQLLEVPYPALPQGYVLVRNHYSVISPGTEGKTVKDARAGYIEKARSRKGEVKKVVQAAKTHGLVKTYNMVMNKLESPSSLGYCCAGEVIDVADDVTEFKVGDRVACGGNSAVHAEVVAVPKNLCVKVTEGIDLKHVAFTTLAAIALQGIRQADLRLGENCVVIGLGLVGQLTMQLLQAGGIKPIGIDLAEAPVKMAIDNGFEAYSRNTDGLDEIIRGATGGHGTDSVIITAGTSSTDPVDLAGELCRKKGKVIIVGNVPTGFDRKAWFRKELELKMSTSYGPGRYDSDYEEKGIDYPIGYVRWTENRNMQAYIDLLNDNKLNIDALISHTFDFDKAKDAYDMIMNKEEVSVGILLKYDTGKALSKKVEVSSKQHSKSDVNIGFVGAGSFAENFLLPNLKGENLFGVATARANNARKIADKYGFSFCSGEADDIVNDENINTVFIATRHNLHAEYVTKALKAGKNVFTEKPLCLTEQELEEIREAYNSTDSHLMVGYNRRFAPHVIKLMEMLPKEQPKAINYRINAGTLPDDHWIHDKEVGGGRIIGEVCHFIDLCAHIAGAAIDTVSAHAMEDTDNLHDTLSIALGFTNGSTASISYFSNGSKELPKEYLEVFCRGQVAVIDDFKTFSSYGNKSAKNKLGSQNKGHKEELKEFLKAIREGSPTPIPFEEIYHSSLVTFKVLESIRTSSSIKL